MDRGKFPVKGHPSERSMFTAAVLGAGAAAPTVPIDSVYPIKTNAVSRDALEIPTRAGVGDYVVFYGFPYKVVEAINFNPQVRGGTAGLRAQVTAVNLVTRALSVRVFTAAGVAADLDSGTAILIIDVTSRDSTG